MSHLGATFTPRGHFHLWGQTMLSKNWPLLLFLTPLIFFSLANSDFFSLANFSDENLFFQISVCDNWQSFLLQKKVSSISGEKNDDWR
jgi:hypothetical protein